MFKAREASIAKGGVAKVAVGYADSGVQRNALCRQQILNRIALIEAITLQEFL